MGLGWDGSPGGRGYRAPYGANKLAKLSRCVSRVHFENYTLQSKSESCWACSFQKIYDVTWSTKVLEILRHQNTLKRTLFSQFQSMQQERNCEKVNFNVCLVIYHSDFNFNVRHRSSRCSSLKVRARPKVQPNITGEASSIIIHPPQKVQKSLESKSMGKIIKFSKE